MIKQRESKCFVVNNAENVLKLNEQMYSEKENKSNKLFIYDWNMKRKLFFFQFENEKELQQIIIQEL